VTATNHALTGAAIGLALSAHPALALPAAFLSHFVLDAIPHFEMPNNNIGTTRFRNYLVLDMLLCVLLVVALFALGTPHWWLVSLCAFVATTPDFMWVTDYVKSQKQGRQVLRSKSKAPWYRRLHSAIQWFAKPLGGIVEAAWLIGAVSIISLLLK
jgi:hypothetical protein